MNDVRRSSGWVEVVEGEQRSASGEKVWRIRGYSVLFDSPSERMGRVVETIDRRAFDHLGDLNKLDVSMLFGHDDNRIVARTTNGSLRLTKDDRGIVAEADLDPGDADAAALYRKIERGLITQQSFGFKVGASGETVRELEDGTVRVHVKRVDALIEVSPVGRPAYRATDVGVIEGRSEACVVCGGEPCECVEDRSMAAEFARLRADLRDEAV